MSDSSPKLRSPIAAYGPIVLSLAAIGIAVAVLFAMGSAKQAAETPPSTGLPPGPSGVSAKEQTKRMGYGDPDEARAESLKLMKTRGMSWFDLTAEEKGKINRLTHGGGRNFYEELVDKERAKTKK
ncbi:MAG: hypothetical protein QM758_19655 [Armatimonas sp.]